MTKEQKTFTRCLGLYQLIIAGLAWLYYRVTGDWLCPVTIWTLWTACCVPKMCQLWKDMGDDA